MRFRVETSTNAPGRVSAHNVEQATDRVGDLDSTLSSIAQATGNDINLIYFTLEGNGEGTAVIQVRQNTADVAVQRIDKYSYIQWEVIN